MPEGLESKRMPEMDILRGSPILLVVIYDYVSQPLENQP